MAKGNELDDLLGGEPEEEEVGFFGEEEAAPAPKPARKKAAAAVDDKPLDVEAELGEGAAHAHEGYVVLARKYRPQTFDEIVGQENVQRALRGAIATGNISHSYLFSGARGTGKTSTARILAKAVNCQNGGPRPDPCGRCASCQAITAGSSLDVIEIDAASNTGVDNIRELRSGVVLAPFSRFKVYIVDEVHMLSTQAFNALLKTLEEPPPQVIFILATTELHKVPETIVSRCQTFLFRRFTTDELKSQLNMILKNEIASRGLTVTDEDREKILDLVARNAEGGMRDAQVALDQVLVFAQGTLDFESVRRFLGMAENDALDAFLRAMYERDVDKLLVMVDEFAASGQDLELFVKSVCEHIRDLLIVRTAPSRSELVNVSDDRHAILRQLAEELPPAFLMNAAAGFLKLSEEMKTAAHPRFLLELAILRLTVVDAVDDVQNILQRLQAVERALSGGGGPSGGGGGGPVAAAPSAAAAPRAATPSRASASPGRPTASIVEAVPPVAAIANAPVLPAAVASSAPVEEHAAPTQEIREATPELQMLKPNCSAEELLQFLQKRTEGSSMLHITLLDCTRILSFDGKTAVLAVDCRDKFGFSHLSRPNSVALMKELAREFCGSDIQIRVETAEFAPKADDGNAAAVAPAQDAPRAQVVPVPVNRPGDGATSPATPTATTTAGAGAQTNRPAAPAVLSTPTTPAVAQSNRLATDSQALEPAEEPERVIYMSPELREKTTREIKGEAFRNFLENQPELKELVEKAKEVFRVDDSQFSFRAKSY